MKPRWDNSRPPPLGGSGAHRPATVTQHPPNPVQHTARKKAQRHTPKHIDLAFTVVSRNQAPEVSDGSAPPPNDYVDYAPQAGHYVLDGKLIAGPNSGEAILERSGPFTVVLVGQPDNGNRSDQFFYTASQHVFFVERGAQPTSVKKWDQWVPLPKAIQAAQFLPPAIHQVAQFSPPAAAPAARVTAALGLHPRARFGLK